MTHSPHIMLVEDDREIRTLVSRAKVAVTLLAADDIAVIDVQDDGPGVPDAVKARVFEPFNHGDHARRADGQDGFGLCLSTSRSIAEAHQGSLSLHYARLAGVVARLTLPFGRMLA